MGLRPIYNGSFKKPIIHLYLGTGLLCSAIAMLVLDNYYHILCTLQNQ